MNESIVKYLTNMRTMHKIKFSFPLFHLLLPNKSKQYMTAVQMFDSDIILFFLPLNKERKKESL